eukprot:15444542-Alexandrium_andersonii.AAC.1
MEVPCKSAEAALHTSARGARAPRSEPSPAGTERARHPATGPHSGPPTSPSEHFSPKRDLL